MKEMPRIAGAIVIGVVWIFFALFPFEAAAQTEQKPAALGAELQPLLDRAKQDGLNVIIVSPNAAENEVVETGESYQERGLRLRREVIRIASSAPQAWHEMIATLRAASPDGTWWWLIFSLAIAALGQLVVWGIRNLLANINKKNLERLFVAEPKNRSEKIGFLLARAFLIACNLFLGFLAAIVVALIFDYDHEPSRATIFIIIVAFTSYWMFRAVILFNIIAHDLPKHRMINLNDEDAKRVQYAWRNSMVAVIIAFAFCAWMDALGINKDVHKLFLMVSMLLAVITFGYLAIRFKREFAAIILGVGEPSNKPLWRRTLASSAHIIMLVYLAVAWVISSFRTVLDLPSANLLVAAPIIAFLGGVATYGIALLVIDKAYLTRQKRFEERVALARAQELERRELEQAAIDAALLDAPEDDEELIINKVMSEKQIEDMPAFKPVFKPLLEDAAGVLISLFAISFVLGTWDVNIGEQGNPMTAFIDTLGIAFVAWFLYRSVGAYIDAQLEEEGVDEAATAGEPGEEMSGHGSSRLATLLPLVRNVLIVTIIVLAAMVMLSNMGVDIAPLFAGAGVIGLAVGFGAQTLIRDIFSGGFFLFDDAFRKGEYIEMENIRGTVEKISLRSFQLRHHNGPLHTIPFGEIKQLTNYSRDWALMKLPLRVTYDTDVEKVRKLIKKLGQRLLEHEEVGELFLQPLKSQGVYKMEDSAMIIRVKFMTKPGNQFITRKVVYAAIRELFENEGIKFAHKEVTVRLAEEPTAPLSETEKKAITAAARSAIDEEGKVPVAADDGL